MKSPNEVIAAELLRAGVMVMNVDFERALRDAGYVVSIRIERSDLAEAAAKMWPARRRWRGQPYRVTWVD